MYQLHDHDRSISNERILNDTLFCLEIISPPLVDVKSISCIAFSAFFESFRSFLMLFDAFCYAFRGLSSDFKGLGGNLNPCRFRNLLMVKSLEISAKLLKTLANQRHFFLAAAIFSLTLPRA